MNNITYAIMACYPDKGMKSYGSKGLFSFNSKKIFEYQFEWIISHNKAKDYEIILICDFDYSKIKKILDPKINIYLTNNFNPVYIACSKALYDEVVCVDYGCLFKPKVLDEIAQDSSSILCTKNTEDYFLDSGCIIKNDIIEHIFLDLPENKFSNIFSISKKDKQKILNNKKFQYFNLLYFEIINMLIDSGSIIKAKMIDHKDFLYFTQMRQKNAINKFIKKIAN